MTRETSTRKPRATTPRPRGVDLRALRALALGLPATEERSVHGTPGFYVGKKLFAWVLKDKGSLVVWIAPEARRAALASAPRIFSITPHYEPHPMVIVELATVGRARLGALLADSWRLRASARIAAARAARSRAPQAPVAGASGAKTVRSK
jgi:hypothetical protein